MSNTTVPERQGISGVFLKETLVKGQPTTAACIDINGQTYVVNRGFLTSLSLEDEWFDDVRDPELVIKTLREETKFRPDIFTFWQRLPEIEPKYSSYHTEWEELAVLPIKTHEHWFNHQIKPRVRNLIRKAEKEGITVRETEYDDAFVRGMTKIFNEAPVRQGRKFWHYGKDFETVKRQFSRFVHREHMIGAYFQGEMIGLIMLGNAGSFGLTGQIISSLKHRDKATNNTLVAKAVEVCAQRQLRYLCYLFWSDDSLAEFKRRCGFEKMKVPRYFIPLTKKGEFMLKYGAHRGWKKMIPPRIKMELKRLRQLWNGRHAAAS